MRPLPKVWSAEFDASPWGGGAVLRKGEIIQEYFSTTWTTDTAKHLGVYPGVSKFQTFWVFYTLYLVLLMWSSRFPGLQIFGDNTGALSNALRLTGKKGVLISIAREISWRKVRAGWVFEVAHLPAEYNVVADASSRSSGPDPLQHPSLALRSARRVVPPSPESTWVISSV